MHALARVGALAAAFGAEGPDEEGVGGAGDVDVPMCLDEVEGRLVSPKRQMGEFLEDGCHFWDFF